MTSNGITIVVPVGPNPVYLAYLPECLESIQQQMGEHDQLLIIDDQAYLQLDAFESYNPRRMLFRTPWLSGCAHAWNFGVALAANEWCILMGSDDKLLPGALDACREVISGAADPLGYYHLTCQLDTGEIIAHFNNAAMVSKALWKHTGGFPITSTVGAPDALLISIMMVHMPQHLLQVKEGTPLYWVRQHEHQDTRQYAAFFNPEVISIRNKETARWTKPSWTEKATVPFPFLHPANE